MAKSEIQGIVFDLDGTLYQCPSYINDGALSEMAFIAQKLRVSVESAKKIITQRKNEGGFKSLSHTVFSLGINWKEWNKVRCDCYRPEFFIGEDPILVKRMEILHEKFEGQIAVASNSPKPVVLRVLNQLGLNHIFTAEKVLGPCDGFAKPDHKIYQEAANVLGLDPSQCVSIGDSWEKDCLPALTAGYSSAVVIKDRDTLIKVIDEFVGKRSDEEDEQFDFDKFIESKYISGQVRIEGITGPAGAGKTTFTSETVERARQKGIPCAVLGLDAFFKLSSRGRKAWIAEGERISFEEGARRKDQIHWWDFQRLEKAIESLRRTGKLELYGVYDRSNGGELTGTLKINSNSNNESLLVILEGVAIAHIADLLDGMTFLNAPAHVRVERLKQRDKHRKGQEVIDRFAITENFEIPYFAEHSQNASLTIDNSNGKPLVLRKKAFCGCP